MGAGRRPSAVDLLLCDRECQDPAPALAPVHCGQLFNQQPDDLYLRVLPVSDELRHRTALNRIPLKSTRRSQLTVTGNDLLFFNSSIQPKTIYQFNIFIHFIHKDKP